MSTGQGRGRSESGRARSSSIRSAEDEGRRVVSITRAPEELQARDRALPMIPSAPTMRTTGLRSPDTASILPAVDARERTLDPVNQVVLDVRDQAGIARLGLMNNQVWRDDPKRLVFTL